MEVLRDGVLGPMRCSVQSGWDHDCSSEGSPPPLRGDTERAQEVKPCRVWTTQLSESPPFLYFTCHFPVSSETLSGTGSWGAGY